MSQSDGRIEHLQVEGADLAKSRAMTARIVKLINLAPDTQEQILFLPRTGAVGTSLKNAECGRSPESPRGTGGGEWVRPSKDSLVRDRCPRGLQIGLGSPASTLKSARVIFASSH